MATVPASPRRRDVIRLPLQAGDAPLVRGAVGLTIASVLSAWILGASADKSGTAMFAVESL